MSLQNNKKIVVAVTEPLLRRLYAYKLSKEWYTVVTAADGNETLRVVETDAPALVMLDLHKPKQRSLDILRKIRGHARSEIASTPVLILGYDPSREDMELALQYGANEYLGKVTHPPAAVIQRINMLLK